MPKLDSVRLLKEAEAFLNVWVSDSRGRHNISSLTDRLDAIASEIQVSGTYTHTAEELAYGARLAWLNSNRCVGRHFWRTLQVRDARDVRTADEVVAQLDAHMAAAFNGGKIRSFITVFAPRTPGEPDPIRISNHQLIRYAHFGEGLGDPATADFTNRMLANGWAPQERTAFTPLPWEIQIAGERQAPRDVFAERPERLVEVSLSHPECDDFAAKGWKWYALPLLSELALKVGGVVYPCAPFNGYYMGTEIGARNLADRDRYNLLPEVAELFGLDTSSERTLWRDRALTELNRAVLHSFDKAGITIGDHHGLGEGFEQFCLAEEKAGREVTGDWVWLNPPMSSPQTPQFHREYRNDVAQHTNFFYQPAPGTETTTAQPSLQNCPFHLPQS